jgi:hypothetical protein
VTASLARDWLMRVFDLWLFTSLVDEGRARFAFKRAASEKDRLLGEFHDQGDAKWIVTKGVIMIRPLGGQPPAGLSATLGLAARRAYLLFLVTIN